MRMLRAGLVLPLGLLLGACTAERSAGAAEGATALAMAAPHELVVRASDYTFDGIPETLPEGATRIRLINDGPDFHHVWLIRLEDGHTLEELSAAFASHGPLPEWAVDVGGPNTPMPGQESNAVVMLEPGRHVVLCVIPGPDGVPHIMKGMVKELTVVAAEGAVAQLPDAELTMILDDYAFGLSAPVTAGRRTIRVENRAAQPHEVLIAKLEPGKTAQELLDFLMNPQGPPPGMPVGGTTGLARGQANVIEVEFTPGDWALICFVPDAKDGKPHFVHGMVQQFTVQ